MNYQYEILNDAYAFEEFIMDLFNEIHQTKSFELYKNQGATQHGIDVYSLEKKIVILDDQVFLSNWVKQS